MTLLSERRDAGVNTFVWGAGVLPDGRYTLAVVAKPVGGGAEIGKTIPIVVDRTLSALTAAPPAFSPNGDGFADTTSVSFTLAQAVPVRIDVEQGGVVLATPFAGSLEPGPQTIVWDGTGADGLLPDGRYEMVVTVTDQLGDVQLMLPITIDTSPPVLKILDPHTLRFSLDEPATVTVLVNQRTRIVRAEPKGAFTIPFQGGVFELSAEAQDAAGNLSAVVTA